MQVGNAAKFFNHRCVAARLLWLLLGCMLMSGLCSCDGGNLCLSVVRARGSLIPALAFTARRDIAEAVELTYAYGEPNDGVASAGHERCLCGTAQCLGYLPWQQSRD